MSFIASNLHEVHVEIYRFSQKGL